MPHYRPAHVPTIFDKHRIRIAKDTMKMSDAGARIMGGMSKTEAVEVLHQFAVKIPCMVCGKGYIPENAGQDACSSNCVRRYVIANSR